MRRRLAWGVAVPLALAGTQAAHAVAYALVYPDAHLRVLTLDRTGHAYLAWLPLAFGLAAACAGLTLVSAALDAARGRPGRAAPPWVFALLAPTVFVAQEMLELSLHSGTFGWRAFAAPTFLPGLLLQAPFALAAYVAARCLLRAAHAVGRAFARTFVLSFVSSFIAPAAQPFAGRPVAPAHARGPPHLVGI